MWHLWERYVQGLGGETDLKETDHLEDEGIDKITLILIFK